MFNEGAATYMLYVIPVFLHLSLLHQAVLVEETEGQSAVNAILGRVYIKANNLI